MKRHRTPLKQTTLSSFLAKRACPPGAIQPNPPPKEVSDSALSENSPPSSLPLSVKASPKKSRSPLKEFNFDDDGFDEEWTHEEPLKFDRWLKCSVVSCELTIRPYQKRVHVENADGKGSVLLRDMWANLNFSAGQEVGVQAALLAAEWVIDAQHGFVSLDPENLVSSTSLIGAMFCRRKGVLSSVFKELDGDSRIMLVGSLVHELFQKALLVQHCTKRVLETIVSDLLALPSTIRMLFTCDLSLEDAGKELKQFIPQILKIIKTFITREMHPDGQNFRGSFAKIVDIEESVSSHLIGIKGRIDVTADVSFGNTVRRMPVEVKTGRASFSNEHRSQVILYTMMLKEIGHELDSGLLVYVREGVVQEIKATHAEMRDLVLLRNEFVEYVRQFDPNFLPDPIHQTNACRKCPYLPVCSAYLNHKHGLQEIAPQIDPKHVEYFKHWSKLLVLEDQTDCNRSNLSLTIRAILLKRYPVRDKFQYVFKREAVPVGVACGSFIRISPQMAEKCGDDSYVGYLSELTDTQCCVLIDREMTQPAGTAFVIEGFRSTMFSRYMSNLAMLLDPRHEELRKLVIDCQPARAVAQIPKAALSETVVGILSKLNKQQQRAVLRALSCENYLLIQGPPGTGKTETIAAMVKTFVANGKSVLLTGHSHSSVDNILLRLDGLAFLRLGNLTNIDSKLHDKAYGKLVLGVKTLDQMRELLMSTPVIATTCLGFDSDLAAKRKFDVCIVDESSQVLQPELLKPLFACSAFVLVGDPKQLQPVVRSVEARDLGMGESMFERLDRDNDARVTLTHQYRMNSTIMDMANQLMYDGILKPGSEDVSTGVLKTTGKSPGWLERVTSSLLEDSLLFIDTSSYLNQHAENTSSCSNIVESKLIAKLVSELLERGLTPDQIGVMSPYRDQVAVLKEAVGCVEVNTVDQYQGRDKDCIIVSCTKQNRSTGAGGKNELLDDERRLCVAVTRAKHKLLFVGDRTTLIARYRPFQRFFQLLPESKIISLQNGDKGFSWESL